MRSRNVYADIWKYTEKVSCFCKKNSSSRWRSCITECIRRMLTIWLEEHLAGYSQQIADAGNHWWIWQSLNCIDCCSAITACHGSVFVYSTVSRKTARRSHSRSKSPRDRRRDTKSRSHTDREKSHEKYSGIYLISLSIFYVCLSVC